MVLEAKRSPDDERRKRATEVQAKDLPLLDPREDEPQILRYAQE
jgi:hypothetical protein